MKKPFYKLKRFYIPCIILIIILAVLAKLLYSPLYTIYWETNHRFEKVQEFRNFEKMTLNPSPKDMIKIVDDYQPKLEDFKDLNIKMQKAIFDFKVAKFFGFEDRYFGVILVAYSDIFIISTNKEHTYFNYLNFISNLNSNEKQKYLNLRASTKDLEKQIFEEKLKFIKHYEEFYDYLDSIGYLDKGAWYKAMALYSKVSIQGMFLLYNTQLCSFKDKLTIFKQVKESYNILKKLDTLEFSNEEINKKWKSNHKAIIIFIGNYLNKIQKALDECK
ncbi:TPA: hypothetical protein SBF13_001827 [Campylobacter jejuni]|uniref:hypothetical protein n=1 Tax=Campylobacter jejuni TaxID=197 RepID=UPI000CD8CCEE|nr:hypothetical protein [Campylobacter jejuni]EAH6838763.1 hypothetical protein [Campylobacter jejuni]EAJ6056929.1 hypothetical protein [Campylobacter jejuni]EAJ7720830.1 hypothetical protein [Campylobacter jejuni]EAK1928042.1 hypothetical protein [Campylobacter jejuni]EDO9955195.1 hypothetical protein [Campylobacter jejuni]